MNGDMVSVKVEIADMDGSDTGPILYKVTHKRDGMRRTAIQRYRVLRAMKDSLIRGEVQTPNVPFPRKQGFLDALFCLPLKAEDLEKRRRGLERYLTAMSSMGGCWESPIATEVLCDTESGQIDAASNENNMVEGMAQGPMGVGPSETESRAATKPEEVMVKIVRGAGPLETGRRELASKGKLWNVASSMMMASREANGISNASMFPSVIASILVGEARTSVEDERSAKEMVSPCPPVAPSLEGGGGASGMLSPSPLVRTAQPEVVLPSPRQKTNKKGKRRGRKGKR